MNKDLKYMPIDDKAGTFMSKHCSPVSYGSPLEKKSCGSPNKKIDPKAISEAVEGAKKYKKYVKDQTAPYDKRVLNTELDKEAYERQQKVKGIQGYHKFHVGQKLKEGFAPRHKDSKKAREAVLDYSSPYRPSEGYPTFRDPKKIKQIKKDLNIKH